MEFPTAVHRKKKCNITAYSSTVQLHQLTLMLKTVFGFYGDCIGFETDAKSLNCKLEDELSGKLTFNVGLAKIDENYGEVIANIRYPVT